MKTNKSNNEEKGNAVLPHVSERCCLNCKHFGYMSSCSDQPFPEFWCSKKHWDGVEDYDSLNEITNCKDFNARQLFICVIHIIF